MDNTLNIPSIYKIEYYQARQVFLPFLANGSVCKISSFAKQNPVKLDFIQNTASLNVNNKDTDASQHFEAKIPFTIAGNNTEDIKTLNTLIQLRHIFVITDASKQKYLIGTNNGARPEITYQIINQKSNRSIKCELTYKSPIFPILVTD